LKRPTARPNPIPRRIAARTDQPLDIALATKIEARPALAPTERSHSPATNGTRAASATRAMTACWETRSLRFAEVGKRSEVFPKKLKNTNITAINATSA